MFKKVVHPFLLLFLLGCFNYPTELNGQKPLDCFNPTEPKNFSLDSNLFIMVMEIYNYDGELVNYGESGNYVSSSVKIDLGSSPTIYWNGANSTGKKVDPGKYTVKVSQFYQNVQKCGCTDVVQK